ncbi:hypothetical protein S245_063535, partial [Arachis hypogaea]
LLFPSSFALRLRHCSPFALRPSPSSLFAFFFIFLIFIFFFILFILFISLFTFKLYLTWATTRYPQWSLLLQALRFQSGTLKPIDIDTLWVHVTCAWFRPEVAFASDEKMEPALGILSIPSSSFVKIRVICKQIHGSCTQCCKCSTYFHAMCASRAGYRMELHISEKNDKQTTKMVFYCAYHRAPNPDNVLIMQILLGVISTKSLLQTKKKRGSRLISSRRTKIMKSLGTMVTEQLLMVLTRKGQCFQSLVQVPQLSFTLKMELKVSPNQPTCHLLVL